MNFRRPDLKSRLLSPRIFIYVAILLIVAWWINRFGRLKEEQASATSMQGTARPSEETILADGGKRSDLPLLVVISLPDEEVREMVASAQRRHAGVCNIVLVTTGIDASDVKRTFQVEKLPAALLFDRDNQEIARVEGEVTVEAVDSLAAKCAKKESQADSASPKEGE